MLPQKKITPLWGFVLAVIGSACYGLNPLFALPLYDMGVGPMTVLLYRYGISAVLMAGIVALRHESFRLTVKELGLALIMGILFAGSSACLFISFKYMDAGLASVILFTYPLFVVLISWAVFHEKMSWITLTCIIVAFIGICLLNEPEHESGMSIVGMLLAVASGLTYALYLIGVNRSVLKSTSTTRLSFYVLLTGTLMFFIASLCEGELMLLPNAVAWMDAVGIALFPTIVSMVLVMRASHAIGSTPTSIIGALEPITALLVSITVFGGNLSAMNIVGIVLVLGAVILMFVFLKREK